ncbi:MAG TPA: phosphatase PAP2 family protein [Gemmatimonadales bacterium]|nr:phosphatase PAP2 family protein [Gemmatimonadales bacterium]
MTSLRAAAAEFRLPAAIVAVFAVLGVLFQAALGYPRMLQHIVWLPVIGYHIVTGSCFLGLMLLLFRWQHRGADGLWIPGFRGWRAALAEGRLEADLRGRTARVAVASLLTAIGATVFDSWKIAIPRLAPFSWDPVLSRLDTAIHGRPPWEYLSALLHWPDGMWLIELIYLSFIPMLAIMTLWHAWSRDERNRRRFYFCFTAAWFAVGVILAMAFSSAGPAFYALVTGKPGPYAPLLSQLHQVGAQVEMASTRIQAALWSVYANGETPAIAGISAMPSLHIAIPTLYCLAARRWWSRLGFALYTTGIWVATIALGWHYAVDGYVAAAASVGVWVLSGRIVRPHPLPHAVAAAPEIAAPETVASA